MDDERATEAVRALCALLQEWPRIAHSVPSSLRKEVFVLMRRAARASTPAELREPVAEIEVPDDDAVSVASAASASPAASVASITSRISSLHPFSPEGRRATGYHVYCFVVPFVRVLVHRHGHDPLDVTDDWCIVKLGESGLPVHNRPYKNEIRPLLTACARHPGMELRVRDGVSKCENDVFINTMMQSDCTDFLFVLRRERATEKGIRNAIGIPVGVPRGKASDADKIVFGEQAPRKSPETQRPRRSFGWTELVLMHRRDASVLRSLFEQKQNVDFEAFARCPCVWENEIVYVEAMVDGAKGLMLYERK